jgi:hypothetical protein
MWFFSTHLGGADLGFVVYRLSLLRVGINRSVRNSEHAEVNEKRGKLRLRPETSSRLSHPVLQQVSGSVTDFLTSLRRPPRISASKQHGKAFLKSTRAPREG